MPGAGGRASTTCLGGPLGEPSAPLPCRRQTQEALFSEVDAKRREVARVGKAASTLVLTSENALSQVRRRLHSTMGGGEEEGGETLALLAGARRGLSPPL